MPSDGRNVILTGFMGTGKSTVGILLAKRLGYCFRDLDALIVERAGISINEIFERYGEPRFRELETEAIRSLRGVSRHVVATGGGAVIAPLNRSLLREAGLVVNLTASLEVILDRLKGDRQRPLLRSNNTPEALGALMAGRENAYADADLRIDTAGKSVEDVVTEIATFVREHQ